MQNQSRQYFEYYETNQRGIVIFQCFFIGVLVSLANYILFGYTELFKTEPKISVILIAAGLAIFGLTVKTAMNTFKNLKQMKKRDLVLRFIARNEHQIFVCLRDCELQGDPVYSILQQIGRKDLLSGYMEYLEKDMEIYRLSMQKSIEPESAITFAGKMIVIKQLPTWVEMHPSRETKWLKEQRGERESDTSLAAP